MRKREIVRELQRTFTNETTWEYATVYKVGRSWKFIKSRNDNIIIDGYDFNRETFTERVKKITQKEISNILGDLIQKLNRNDNECFHCVPGVIIPGVKNID